jgi:hypothetical protein
MHMYDKALHVACIVQQYTIRVTEIQPFTGSQEKVLPTCRCELCMVSIKHSWLMTINASLEGMNNINLQMNTADQKGSKTL